MVGDARAQAGARGAAAAVVRGRVNLVKEPVVRGALDGEDFRWQGGFLCVFLGAVFGVFRVFDVFGVFGVFGVLGGVFGHAVRPPFREDAPHVGLEDSVNDLLRHLGRVGHDNGPKAHVHQLLPVGAGAGDKLNQVARGLILAPLVEEPVPRHPDPVGPVEGRGNNRR